jgi:hypothetical protein
VLSQRWRQEELIGTGQDKKKKEEKKNNNNNTMAGAG